VVWGLRTQPCKSIGQTPFSLVYGSEAILPADIMWQSARLETYQEGEADEARHLELDTVEEARCNALVQSARYLQGIRRYHDRNVQQRCNTLVQSAGYLQGVRRYHDHNIQQRSFSIADMVLRRIQNEEGLHKLNSRWEGPFIVSKVTRPGSYRLQHPDGTEVPNSWNIEYL